MHGCCDEVGRNRALHYNRPQSANFQQGVDNSSIKVHRPSIAECTAVGILASLLCL